MITIEVENLAKRFGAFEALRGVSLSVEPGNFLALLGPSGSGKTTLLRMIAGLDFPDSGTIRFSGQDMSRRAARDRRVGFVFQHYALFRHMNVADNIAFGLTVRPRRVRPPAEEIKRRVGDLLALVQLEGIANRFPHQLSGGQRQRVALARALAIEPSVLLLDEPFGALDAKVRKDLRRWLRHLHEQMGLTTVFVTHDQEEALELADRVVLMNQGRIEQIGGPQDIYDRPASPFVFDFLGEVNHIPCRVENGHAMMGETSVLLDEPLPDGPATAFVRPHDILLAEPGDADLIAVVSEVFSAGPVAHVELKVQSPQVTIEAQTTRLLAQALDLRPGRAVGVHIGRLRVFSDRS